MPLPPQTTGRGPLRISIEDWFKTFLIPLFAKPVTDWLTRVNEDFYNYMLGFFDLRGITKNTPTEFAPYMTGKNQPSKLLQMILAVTGFFAGIAGVVQAAAGPNNRYLQRIVNRINQDIRPDVGTLIQIARRRPEFAAQMQAWMKEAGADPGVIDALTTLDQPLLSAADYTNGFFHSGIDNVTMTDKWLRLGYARDELSVLTALIYQDLSSGQAIEEANHDAGNSGLASQYDLDAGMTADFLERMKKLHYDNDTAVRIWRMTRGLPNIGQAFDMFHRLRPGRTDAVFSEQDLDFILRSNGIPDWFVARFKAASETPYPRLILQGLYRNGQLSADEVLEAVYDLGYSGDRAQKVTDYLTRDAKSAQQGLSRDAILKAYTRGVYDRAQTHDGLITIGLSEEDAAFYIALADQDLQAQMTDAQLQVIQAKYVGGTIDETGLAVELGRLDLPSERVTELSALWNIQRTNKTNVPGRSELDDLLRRSIIDHETYRAVLHRDGYEDQTIEWFVTRIDQILAQDAQVELQTTQTEQQRLATATLKNQYQTLRADNAVKVAQLKSAIADIALALHSITDPAQIAALKAQSADYTNQIVHVNEDNANLYAEYLAAQATPGGA